jgi:hypothetical protein
MDRPIKLDLTGVIHGTTITLDEGTCLPDGHRVTLQLLLTREEAPDFSFGAWKDLTPEEIAWYEQEVSEFSGEPFRMPPAGED